MTWEWVCLILGLVWWLPVVIVCGIAANKQKLAETAYTTTVAEAIKRLG